MTLFCRVTKSRNGQLEVTDAVALIMKLYILDIRCTIMDIAGVYELVV